MNTKQTLILWLLIVGLVVGGILIQQGWKHRLEREAFWLVNHTEDQVEKAVLLGSIIQQYEGDISSEQAAAEIQSLIDIGDEVVNIEAVRYMTLDTSVSGESYISEWSRPQITEEGESIVLPLEQEGVASAMVRARNQGIITATPPILIEDEMWFWVTVPLYTGGGVPEDPDARRNRFEGYLQIALKYDALAGSRLDRLVELTGAAFRLRDVDPETNAKTDIAQSGSLTRKVLDSFRRVDFVDRVWYFDLSAGATMIVRLRIIWGSIIVMVLMGLMARYGTPSQMFARLRRRYRGL